LGGYDVVLGIEWLMTQEPNMWNFDSLTMQFQWGEHIVTLNGLSPTRLSLKDGHHFLKSSTSRNKVVLLQLYAQELANLSNTIPEPLQEIVQEFESIFVEAKGLPPPRFHDHQILLKGTQPISVNPYRYPYYQKTEIEKIICELLESRVIRPSQSPFFAHVLLVRKLDGCWRMCVDYRALNQDTIKDKYPIPIIDELLDELHGAKIFYKLDLRPRYH
jgi:hypothetical protein